MENNDTYQPPANAAQPAAQKKPTTAMGITSLVLGILAIISSWVPIVNNFSAILGLLGAIFGIVGIVGVVRGKKSGKAMAIIATVLNVVAIVVVLATQSAYSAAMDEALNGPAATTATTSQPAADTAASSDAAASTEAAKQDFSNLAVGTAATLENGVTVSVDSVETGLTNYDGSAITAVHVTYSNGSSQEQSFNSFDWKAQDAQGALRDATYYSNSNGTELSYGSLAAGGTVSGTVYFDGDIVKVNYYASVISNSATAAWVLA